MIVRNEAHVIQRCLESALPLIDYALIVDTGSSDGTEERVREFFRDRKLAGDVISEPWRDFAYNRTFAIDEMRKHSEIDYCLVIDADDLLVLDPGFDAVAFKAALEADTYEISIQHGQTVYPRPQLFSNRRPFRYRGVLHEYLDCPGGHSRAAARGLHIRYTGEGDRSRNPHKYRHDAKVLEDALRTETDPFLIARYTFYLAQSYRDCGEMAKAVECYLRRAELGLWQQEIFVSLLNAGRLKERLGHPEAEVIDTYMRSVESCDSRAEGHYEVARFCRQKKRYRQAYLLSKAGLAVPQPSDGLFTETSAYQYGLLDEFAVAAYWTGNFEDCLNACNRLLEENRFPASERERIVKNAAAAQVGLNVRNAPPSFK